MKHRYLYILAALVFFLAACSSDNDLTTIPNLELQFGSVDYDTGVDVATASSGRIYTLSQRNGPYDQNGYPDGYGDYSSAILQRYDSSGAVIWEEQIARGECDPDPDFLGSDCGSMRAISLVADAQGNVHALVVNTYRGTSMDVDYNSLSYEIIKYNALGRFVSELHLDDGDSEDGRDPRPASFTVDNNGNAYVTRYTHNGNAYIVAKYSTSGTRLWQRTSRVGIPYAITVSNTGFVYVTGSTGMARYSNTGNLAWTKTGTSYSGSDRSTLIASGASLYLSVPKTGTVRKFDANGKLLWSRVQSGLNTLVFGDMTADANGNVYIAGKYRPTTSSPANVFVRKLRPTGAILWTKTFGTPQYDDARGIATINGSEIYVTGETQGSLAHSNYGGSDGYLRKLNSLGNTVWTR